MERRRSSRKNQVFPLDQTSRSKELRDPIPGAEGPDPGDAVVAFSLPD
jgi:hypothetical protein